MVCLRCLPSLLIYVGSGGLRSVAYVDCAQCVLLALGIIILGGIAVHYSGGSSGLMTGLADMVAEDIANDVTLTPAGYSSTIAIPGSIQFVSAGSKAVGGTWTGIMLFALMGIQSSPAFSMWAFSNKTSRSFR